MAHTYNIRSRLWNIDKSVNKDYTRVDGYRRVEWHHASITAHRVVSVEHRFQSDAIFADQALLDRARMQVRLETYTLLVYEQGLRSAGEWEVEDSPETKIVKTFISHKATGIQAGAARPWASDLQGCLPMKVFGVQLRKS